MAKQVLFHLSTHGGPEAARNLVGAARLFQPHVILIENARGSAYRRWRTRIRHRFADLFPRSFLEDRARASDRLLWKEAAARRQSTPPVPIGLAERYNRRERHDILAYRKETRRLYRNALQYYGRGQVSPAIDSFNFHLIGCGQQDAFREHRTVQHFEIAAHSAAPNLAVDDLRLLVFFGSSHLALPFIAHKAGWDVSISLDCSHLVQPLFSSTILRLRSALPVAPEDIGRALVESILALTLEQLELPFDISFAVARILAEPMSLETITQLSERLPRLSYDEDVKTVFRSLGIPFPHTLDAVWDCIGQSPYSQVDFYASPSIIPLPQFAKHILTDEGTYTALRRRLTIPL